MMRTATPCLSPLISLETARRIGVTTSSEMGQKRFTILVQNRTGGWPQRGPRGPNEGMCQRAPKSVSCDCFQIERAESRKIQVCHCTAWIYIIRLDGCWSSTVPLTGGARTSSR